MFAAAFNCFNSPFHPAQPLALHCALAVLLEPLPLHTAQTLLSPALCCWHLGVQLLAAAAFLQAGSLHPLSNLLLAECSLLLSHSRSAAPLLPPTLLLQMDLRPSPVCCFSTFCTV